MPYKNDYDTLIKILDRQLKHFRKWKADKEKVIRFIDNEILNIEQVRAGIVKKKLEKRDEKKTR